MHVYGSSKQALHFHVYSVAFVKCFFLTVIYGSNNEVERSDLWSEMRSVKKSMPPTIPWLVFGDFNVIHHMSKRSDYFDGMPVFSEVQDFQNVLKIQNWWMYIVMDASLLGQIKGVLAFLPKSWIE